RVAGSISKDFSGEIKTHKFIRADVFADRDAAIQATVRKAQLIVDQSSDTIF
ncbi:MAG: HlyU family transcriptional regulator, partial [Notoacmeibacter sp.]